ncbi:MAG: PD-(D/E)XK nuclease family protein, partial [Deltaproteobacteria bacterium]|nr:PD-(D/E)XK nuclease family protein [Deltaproteobacteria bacterium]
VLKYKARLEPGNLSALPSGSLLFGNLSHRLIEELFATHRDWTEWTEEKIHQWLDNRVPELLEKEGAILLLPGYAAERDVFHASLRQAFPALVKGLNLAGIRTVEVESAGTCPFFGGELHCRIDLLLKDPSGREIVLDAKWGGKKYRREALEENASLQLAVYAFMRKSLTGAAQWPSQAFFIIDDAVFLAQDQKTFPAAELCLPRKEGENSEDFWRRFEVTWKWRRKQLDDGWIEVPVDGTLPDEASEPPEGGLDLSKSIDRFNKYDGLTGWKEGE